MISAKLKIFKILFLDILKVISFKNRDILKFSNSAFWKISHI